MQHNGKSRITDRHNGGIRQNSDKVHFLVQIGKVLCQMRTEKQFRSRTENFRIGVRGGHEHEVKRKQGDQCCYCQKHIGENLASAYFLSC